jgi:hypothetical protein
MTTPNYIIRHIVLEYKCEAIWNHTQSIRYSKGSGGYVIMFPYDCHQYEALFPICSLRLLEVAVICSSWFVGNVRLFPIPFWRAGSVDQAVSCHSLHFWQMPIRSALVNYIDLRILRIGGHPIRYILTGQSCYGLVNTGNDTWHRRLSNWTLWSKRMCLVHVIGHFHCGLVRNAMMKVVRCLTCERPSLCRQAVTIQSYSLLMETDQIRSN